MMRLSRECIEWHNKVMVYLEAHDDYEDALKAAGEPPKGCREALKANYERYVNMSEQEREATEAQNKRARDAYLAREAQKR